MGYGHRWHRKKVAALASMLERQRMAANATGAPLSLHVSTVMDRLATLAGDALPPPPSGRAFLPLSPPSGGLAPFEYVYAAVHSAGSPRALAAQQGQRALYLFDAASGPEAAAVVERLLALFGGAVATPDDKDDRAHAVLINRAQLSDVERMPWADYGLFVASVDHPVHERYARFANDSSSTADQFANDSSSTGGQFAAWLRAQPDNLLVRRFCGPACWPLGRGRLDAGHLLRALNNLYRFDVVVDRPFWQEGVDALAGAAPRSGRQRTDAPLAAAELVRVEPMFAWDLLFYEHARFLARRHIQHAHYLRHVQTSRPVACASPGPCGCDGCSMF